MKRFRISEDDTIKAVAVSEKTGKLLSSLYDSGFSTISEVKNSLLRKIIYFEGKKISIRITNEKKETYKNFVVKVN